jgi:integrase
MTERKSEPIKTVVLADGSTKYRFVIDVGKKPDGRRDQRTYTYEKLKQARAERARIISERARGTYVATSKLTLGEAVAAWLSGKINIQASTRRTYSDALALATIRLGHIKVHDLAKTQIDKMIADVQTNGRRKGYAKTLSPRSVNLMLTLLSAVLDDLVRQGTLGRNVVKMADRPDGEAHEKSTWEPLHAQAFLDVAADDRLYAAWQLSLYGLRRGEVLGLRWSDVDLVAKTITVRWTRGMVGSDIIEKPPKSRRSTRTLPLDDDLVSALDALSLCQRDEQDAAGEAYADPCPLCPSKHDGRHVVVNELGQPYRPEWFGKRFAALAKVAKVPAIRLHDARHTCGTLMHLRGVPIAVISAWLGHASAAFTMKTYVHSQDVELATAGATLRGAITAPKKAGVINP